MITPLRHYFHIIDRQLSRHATPFTPFSSLSLLRFSARAPLLSLITRLRSPIASITMPPSLLTPFR
jgi:hypothetical protein